jgi:hypothetical protein
MSSLPIERDVPASNHDPAAAIGGPADLEPIRAAIRGIRFGEVRIVIQDGKVIQIDQMEKQRIR